MATIIYPDDRQEEVQPRNGHDFKLEELQTIVGGYIEIIPTRDGRIMVINEEGKLNDLPRNREATQLIDFPSPEEMRAIIMESPNTIFAGDFSEPEYVAGTVLVCENKEVR